MPLPSPKGKEKREDFLKRCMDDDTMNKEFKDSDERYAVCITQWEETKTDNNQENENEKD